MFQKILSFFTPSKPPQTTDPTVNYLIVGLGNIGKEYAFTRHNIGFEVVDDLAKKHQVTFETDRLAMVAGFRFKGRKFTLIKPTTYMNLSGKAVRYWMQQLKIQQENVLVIVDDLDLEFGKLRLKAKGSPGSHNGLKDIDKVLGNNKYARLRFGIDKNFSRGRQVDYVLGRWTDKEADGLIEYIPKASEIVESFATIGINRTMNLYN